MGNTPASGKRMPDGPTSPAGMTRSRVMDCESPNCSEAWDGKKVVMPIEAKDYLKDAAGQA